MIAVGVLLLLAWALAPRDVAWAHALQRLKPGAGGRAEWMAPPGVVRAVKRDFLAAQAWLAETAHDWGLFANELERYAAGAYLKRQRAALRLLAQHRGPRLASIQAAEHLLAVRQFSADGLRCLLIDQQTHGTLTTSRYWSGALIHCQRLPAAVFVWQMGYDRLDRRWKIERLVQTLPAGNGGVRVTLAVELPASAGRDD